MARRYIADCHFDHEALNVAMDKRGFQSVESMNEYMIKQWNSVVKRGDDVIILGDFCVSRDPERIRKLLLQLKGKKYMILGNHDSGIRNKQFDTTLSEEYMIIISSLTVIKVLYAAIILF